MTKEPFYKKKYWVFVSRRLAELVGLALIALGGGALWGWVAPTTIPAAQFFLLNKELLTAQLGGTAIAFPFFMLSWGFAIVLHRKGIWRLWRFFLVMASFVGLNFALSATPLKGAFGVSVAASIFATPLLQPLVTALETYLWAAVLGFSFLFAASLPVRWLKFFGRRKRLHATDEMTPQAANNLSPLVESLKNAAPPPKNPRYQEERRWHQRVRDNLAARAERRQAQAAAVGIAIADKLKDFFHKKEKGAQGSEEQDFYSPQEPLSPPAVRQQMPVPPPPAPENKTKQTLKRIKTKTPPFNLVTAPPKEKNYAEALAQAKGRAQHLDNTLKDFKVDGKIERINAGPVVSLFEFLPAAGVKSSRLIGLSDDIARSMSSFSARIANIPGQNAIGIEIPNEERKDVHFAHLLNDPAYKKSAALLPLILGSSISGEPVIADLATMPHLLVAGTTGSGKSVAINAMILSLLYRLRADECAFIMIDPKMLELSVYQDIPHLLTPVVTDPKKAVAALKWVVREMEERYKKMSLYAVRSIGNYNKKAEQKGADKLPFIVVIIDEMADLMMVAGKEIEAAVQRLAQMARAAGIHLIAATQRPSVDVITGTIKANFPTRISFQVSSKIDSRTILGEGGAEQLLGKGDMLWMQGGGKLQRVHGPFVSDSHVEEVASFLRDKNPPPAYQEEITDDDEVSADGFPLTGGEADELYQSAVQIVRENKRASTSFLQRKLSIGYNRAAKIMEQMEERGVISAPMANGKRTIVEDDNYQQNAI